MDNKVKAILSVLIAVLILVPLVPLTVGFEVPSGADSEDWYMTVEGVLSTDKYVLYPYEAKDLTIGFSKFGEMINSIDNIGLQYGTDDDIGRDPFAPPYGDEISSIGKNVWLEGWLLNITYVHQTKGFRNIWAMAQHSDLVSFGNGWIRVDDDYPVGPNTEEYELPTEEGYFIGSSPAQYGNGGRKTNGTVVTEPIEVLYDGPRRFVARVVNHVYDWLQSESGDDDDPVDNVPEVHLVDVIITIDFNKDKKEVILMKDVKLIPQKGVYREIPEDYFLAVPDGWLVEEIGGDWLLFKYNEIAEEWYGYDGCTWNNPSYLYPDSLWEVPLAITEPISAIFCQFSNRGEWDLGKKPDFKSYVHFFTAGDWEDWRDLGMDAGWTDFYDDHYFDGNGVYPPWWLPEIPPTNPHTEDDVAFEGLWTVYGSEYTLTSTIFPNAYSRHGPEPFPAFYEDDGLDSMYPGYGSTFDVAQMIGENENYVAWAAYWPSVSDWSVAGLDLGQWWKSLASYDKHSIDYYIEPWQSPYIIGEWDFLLTKDPFVIEADITEEYPGPEMVVKADEQFRGVTVYGITDLHTEVYGDGPEEGPDSIP